MLSDATGAIHLAHDAVHADAKTVHTTIMTLLHSNVAAVGSTAAWTEGLQAGTALLTSNLVSSGTGGRQRATDA